VRLKQHYLFENEIDFEKSIVKKGTELEKIIQLFEEKSRNYDGVDFSKAPAGKKKLLISGYDPFVLNPKKYGNPLQSNPSGITALSLHGKTIGDYHIQTFVFPVRYKDFDEYKNGKGVVETFFEPHLQNVDMIITVSQGGDFRFDVDRFPCKHRGGFMDNMFWGIEADGYNEQNFIQLSAGKEFYETTLPYKKIVPNKNNPSDTFWTYFNQTFEAFGDKYNKENVEGVMLNKKLSDIQTLTSILGSGSNYLSNEIFYRVAKMRTEQRPTLATGHLHLPRIQQKIVNTFPRGNVSTEDMNPKITELIAQIKTIIIKI
jgi:pyrrolidone-carboxylate peptidase